MDAKGQEILESIQVAKKFNLWMYETISPFLGSKVFEVGSGIGNISEIFFSHNDGKIMLSDLNPEYCDVLLQKFGTNDKCLGVESIDLIDPDFPIKYQKYFNHFDAVFALNVVEHIADDKLAIKNAKLLLKNTGRLIVLVPSYDFLYNKVDFELGHYKRYNRESLSEIFRLNNLQIIHSQYFNFAGIPSWFINGKILKNDGISVSKMKLFNEMVPIFRIADAIIDNRIGLSTIVIGQKSE